MKFLPCGIAIVLAASLALAACGGTSAPTTTKATDIVFGDCSSFKKFASDYLDEMITFAKSAALKARRLEYGCVDGAPLRTLHLKEIDFGKVTKEVAEDQTLRWQLAEARALGLRSKFRAMIAQPEQIEGSGQLEALELAAQQPDVVRVAFWTDAIPNQIGGINLATASRSRIDTTARRWARRMNDGLKGVEIFMLGVGRGVRSGSATVRNAQRLFRDVVEGAGGHLIWSASLPPLA